MTIIKESLHVALSTVLIAAMVYAETAFGTDPIFAGAEKVEFESVSFTYTPSPFKVRQAKKLGIPVEIKTEPSVPLSGYLARPVGNEPRAAIVLLHPCVGISEFEEMWSDRLVAWGYVVLSVDSFTPRGVKYICDSRDGYIRPWTRALDAYGAKRYLSTLAYVDPARIAVMGMSHGGMTVLEAIKQSISEGLATKPFQAAIAFYPLCSVPEPINTSILILSGSEDNWTPAVLCEQYVDKLRPRHEITLKVIEGAYHGFDLQGVDGIDAGHIVRYNPKAAAEAIELSRKFLQERL